MKFSGKMCFKIILKVTKKQGFSLSLEDTLFEKPQLAWEGKEGNLTSKHMGTHKWVNKFIRLIVSFDSNHYTLRTFLILGKILVCKILNQVQLYELLFYNMPFDETIDIIIKESFKKNQIFSGLNKQRFFRDAFVYKILNQL